MANITISELRPAGFELFQDSESFLNDLNDMDSVSVHGGEGDGYNEYARLGGKVLEYGLAGFGVNNIVSIVKSYSGY